MGELTICKKKPILYVEKNYHDHEKLLGPSRWFVILHLWDKLHGVMLTACPAVLTTQPATDRGKRPLEFVLQRPCGVSAHFLLLFQPFFFPSDLRFHLLDQVCQQCLTFLSGLGVHIAGVFFAIWPDGGVPSFPQMVVDLADTAGAWLAALTLVGLKGAEGRFSGRSFGRLWGWQASTGNTRPRVGKTTKSNCKRERWKV